MKTWATRATGAVLGGIVFAIAACSSTPDGASSAAPDEKVGTTQEAIQQSAGTSAGAGATASRTGTGSGGGAKLHVTPVYNPQLRLAANACGGTTPKLTYLGGSVIQSPQIVSVLWTANVDPNVTSKIGSFYTDLLASSYFDMLGEYSTGGLVAVDGQAGTTQGISRGNYVGQYTITPSLCAGSAVCTVSDAQIGAELAAQIAAGHLPPVTTGCDGQTSSFYVFEFPANVTITLTSDGTTSSSCAAFCGYHEHTTVGGQVVPYGVIPDLESGPCKTACSASSNADFNDVTSIHSHEIAEAVTDANVTIDASGYVRPSAWGDESCGEIGDICSFQETATSLNGTTWTVQQLWSNAVGDCTITGKPPAVCTGANSPAGCRACECVDVKYGGPTTALGCDGATPWCETGATNVKHGDCVQCTTTSGCASKQVCEQSSTAASDDICAACGAAGNLCCAGNACTSPNSCGGGGTAGVCGCTPLAACPAGESCGSVANGCGGTVNCGSCTAPQTCGGGGSANVCGCTPIAACSAGDNCGSVADGCGGMVTCGTACTSPQTCGGGGSANVCGCTPIAACPAGDNCGSVPDGCGGAITCGPACTSPQTCAGSGTPNVCGCTPLEKCPAADSCGSVADGCGGTVACGACSGGQTCAGNQCVALADAGTQDSGTMMGGHVDSGVAPVDSGVASVDAGAAIDGSAGSDGSPENGDASTGTAGSSGGCGCRTVDPSAPTPPALAGLGVLALAGLRRRRRHPV